MGVDIVDRATNLIEIGDISKFEDTTFKVGNESNIESIKELEESSEITDPSEKIRLWRSAYSFNSEWSNEVNISASDYETYFQVDTRKSAEDIDLDYCTSDTYETDEQQDKLLANCRGWNAYCANPSRMSSGMGSSGSNEIYKVLNSLCLSAVVLMLIL